MLVGAGEVSPLVVAAGPVDWQSETMGLGQDQSGTGCGGSDVWFQ